MAARVLFLIFESPKECERFSLYRCDVARWGGEVARAHVLEDAEAPLGERGAWGLRGAGGCRGRGGRRRAGCGAPPPHGGRRTPLAPAPHGHAGARRFRIRSKKYTGLPRYKCRTALKRYTVP